MISEHNIICLASSYAAHPTGKHHLMRGLARHNRVTWINVHASRVPRPTWDDATRAWRRLRRCLAPQPPAPAGIEVRSPLLLPLPHVALARRQTAARVRGLVRRVMGARPGVPTDIWSFTPELPEVLGDHPGRRIYCCVDDFPAFADVDAKLMTRLEEQTLAAADVVFATSPPLLERCRARHANAHLVPHGVDVEHFGAACAAECPLETPAELLGLPRPIVGYFGLIAEWLDVELVADAARRLPDCSFVLLGRSATETAAWRARPNIHLFGPRDYAELPAWCRAFDVGVIPFRQNRLVAAVNPIKLREYLAAGLPVVSTPMPAVAPYAPPVRIAGTAEAFANAIAAAIADRTPPAELRACVEHESWSGRLAQMCAVIDETPPRRPTPPGSAIPQGAAGPADVGRRPVPGPGH